LNKTHTLDVHNFQKYSRLDREFCRHKTYLHVMKRLLFPQHPKAQVKWDWPSSPL